MFNSPFHKSTEHSFSQKNTKKLNHGQTVLNPKRLEKCSIETLYQIKQNWLVPIVGDPKYGLPHNIAQCPLSVIPIFSYGHNNNLKR